MSKGSLALKKVWVVIPAAGSGKRMGLSRPKQYLPLLGKTVIEHTVSRLLSSEYIAGVILALSKDDATWKTLSLAQNENVLCVEGGAERIYSVKNGLLKFQNMCKENPDELSDWVLVHDAVRPCVSTSDIEHLINSLWSHPVGGLLASPVVDTLKQVDGENNVLDTLDRSLYWRAQTPQMFKATVLLDGIERAISTNFIATDESSIIESMGLQSKVVKASADNLKLTYQEDLPLLEAVLSRQIKESGDIEG